MIILVFFFKQKTAYEMRISDWSSDVCSSDLCEVRHQKTTGWYFTYGSTSAGANASKPPTYATQFFPNATLKLQYRCTGSFRLTAGTPHLHGEFNFPEHVRETVGTSLRHTCRSELTRQGLSLP